jgi:hypothetical protein
LAGGAGGKLGRGASSAAAVAPEGGRRARVGYGGRFLSGKRGRGHFSNMAWGADAPDRLLPRPGAGTGASANYLGSNPYRHKIGLAGGASILTPGPKTVPADD